MEGGLGAGADGAGKTAARAFVTMAGSWLLVFLWKGGDGFEDVDAGAPRLPQEPTSGKSRHGFQDKREGFPFHMEGEAHL